MDSLVVIRVERIQYGSEAKTLRPPSGNAFQLLPGQKHGDTVAVCILNCTELYVGMQLAAGANVHLGLPILSGRDDAKLEYSRFIEPEAVVRSTEIKAKFPVDQFSRCWGGPAQLQAQAFGGLRHGYLARLFAVDLQRPGPRLLKRDCDRRRVGCVDLLLLSRASIQNNAPGRLA